MTHSLSKKDKPTEADAAYQVLKAQGSPMHYQSLMEQVVQSLGGSLESIRIADALTQINLDTRFIFLGRGEWGLRVWETSKVSRRSPSVALISKTSSEEEDKADSEELEEDPLDEEATDTDPVFDEADEGQRGEKW